MKFIAIILAAVLIFAVTCTAQKEEEVFAPRKSMVDKAKEKLAELTKKITKSIDDVLVKIKNKSQKVVTKIEDATKKCVNAVDKEITVQLNIINKLAKEAQDKGFDSGKCVEKPTNEVNKKKSEFTNGVWLCNKDGIGFISKTVDTGIKDLQTINDDVKQLGIQLENCKGGLLCIVKFLSDLTSQAISIPKKIANLLKSITEIMDDTFTNFLKCQTSVQTSFLDEGLKITAGMTKCLKDLLSNYSKLYV